MSRPVKSHLLPAAACVLAALLLYLPFRSASLDDFDSYNFVRALTEFNPARYQPQPPGYVLYVWLGRAALALLADPRLALTTLSAVSAALSCGLLFLTGSLLFNRRVGLIATLLVVATPLMWLNAGKALSDAAGLCAQAVAALALALALRRRLPLWVATGLIGVAAGFRPQAVVGIGLMWIVLAAWQRPPARVWAGCLVAGAIGALSWLLPTLAAFNWNVDAMRGYMSAPVGFVVGQESLFATALSAQSIAARLQVVWELSSRVGAPGRGFPAMALVRAAGGSAQFLRAGGLCRIAPGADAAHSALTA
jgi:4-amino-4-deoxy-L-arabinose transferase-like glycosyltransferase